VNAGPRPPTRIETERLLLRPWRIDDAPLLHTALTESVEHLKPWIPWATPEAPTSEETYERLRTWVEEFEAGDNFVYAVFDRAEDELMGGIGLYPRIGPGGLEIGYWMRSTRAGLGFATEASRALTHAGFGVRGVGRIEVHCDPANFASSRIPEKLGYRLVEVRRSEPGPDGTKRDTAVFELTRHRYDEDWDSGRS
jgi:RimJ/RimL family protein N-acetyltransferase